MLRRAVHVSLLLLLVLVAAHDASAQCARNASAATTTASVLVNATGAYRVVWGVLDRTNGVAIGRFNDTACSIGWGVLQLRTSATYEDAVQMFAAGYLEGALTAPAIYDYYRNIIGLMYGDVAPRRMAAFRRWFAEQDAWTRAQVERAGGADPFWRHVGLLLAQFDGLLAGYNAHTTPDRQLTAFELQSLNAEGDLWDLVLLLAPELRPDWSRMSRAEAMRYAATRGHCSALVRVTPDLSDLLMAHSTWDTFRAMNRIYKTYDLRLRDPAVAVRRMSFSSYPAYLESSDDFYMLDNGLVVLETTNTVYNMSLLERVQPHSLITWIRVRTASALARTGAEWVSVLARHNSGTYNNQYMVVDTNRFVPGRALLDGTLWVAEQIPTLVQSADLTAVLRLGYWPSYNVPFFENVYNLSGYPQRVARYGDEFSYQACARARIFRRDAVRIDNPADLKRFMRSNRYDSDPYSAGDPLRAICARGDLAVPPSPHGCHDTKVTAYAAARRLVCEAEEGPTHDTLPAFDWSAFPTTPHYGMPGRFNFSFVPMAPSADL